MLPDGFPAGLRVFVIGDDSVVLRMLEKMLLQCGYKVTISHCPLQALELLRANISNYDIVLIDVDLTCMDGYQLLENVNREINLPIIVLSVNSDFRNVMKGIKYGAIDHLVKPLRLEELKLIWKHVVKNFLNEKKRKRDDEDIILKDNLVSHKRTRFSWTPELHAKFINVLNHLGVNNAVPMKILEVMDIPGLTRENVASHLQKYRKGLKRNAIVLEQQYFDNTKTRRDSESFLPMTINECNDNLNRNKSMSSSYFMGQQSYDDHALIPQTWYSSDMRYQNSFCQQSMMGSLENQIKNQQLGWTTEPYMMNMSTQNSGYQSNNESLNQLDCQAQNYENSRTSDGHNELNPIPQLESTADIFLNNNLNDNNYSDELGTLLAFEQKQQQNSFDSSDVQSYSLEDHGGSKTSNLTILSEFDNLDDTDELYVALSQFQY